MSAFSRRLKQVLPAAALAPLRRGRDRLQRFDARLRRRLPTALGGTLEDRVDASILGPQDIDDYLRLRANDRGSRRGVERALGRSDRFCVGLRLGRRLVAVGWCLPLRKLFGSDEWFFASDFVHPHYRRRGLARALHRHRLHLAAQRGLARVHAHVDANNAASLAALRAVGFYEIDNAQWHARLREHRREVGAPAGDPIILACSTTQ